MIGHPDETMTYYSQLKKFLRRLGPDEVRLSFLTPFPGTPLWANYRRESVCTSIGYEDYTTFRPILQHPLFSEKELQEIRKEILIDYYFSDAYMNRVNCKIDRFPYLSLSFDEFMEETYSQLRGGIVEGKSQHFIRDFLTQKRTS